MECAVCGWAESLKAILWGLQEGRLPAALLFTIRAWGGQEGRLPAALFYTTRAEGGQDPGPSQGSQLSPPVTIS